MGDNNNAFEREKAIGVNLHQFSTSLNYLFQWLVGSHFIIARTFICASIPAAKLIKVVCTRSHTEARKLIERECKIYADITIVFIVYR